MAPPPDAATAWHTLDRAETLARLDTAEEGLSEAEARRRLERHGPNRLDEAESVSAWRVLLDQGRSLLVAVLAVAAFLALLLGDLLEAAALGVVLLINTAIGFGVELRARRAMDALVGIDVPTARVRRGGSVRTLSADELVPGDVVELREGDRVPADARLLSATGLRVDEAVLTGESVAVDKAVERLTESDTVLAERAPLLYAGTTVASGSAVAVVFATGAATEVGRVGALVKGIESGKTPLERRLDGLGRRMVALTAGVAGVVIGLGLLRGQPARLVVETGVALAIAAMPEGLPAVATIALAVGLRRMARRNALVRRLAAVEALGATTVVCTDKTGTLTAGEMTAARVATLDREMSVTGEGYAADGQLEVGEDSGAGDDDALGELLRACALTSRAQVEPDGSGPVGDPTDLALLVLARKGGIDPELLRPALPELGEVPFDTARRMSASIHRGSGEERVVYAKGAPEAVLASSSFVLTGDGRSPMTDDRRARLEERNRTLSSLGLRVIALARAPDERLQEMTHLGLVGIVDPPAPGVRETVATLLRAGIRTVMITGDQRATAAAIARRLGVVGEDAAADLTGRELETLSDDELAGRARGVQIYSRVSPEQKLRIVEALQGGGEVVAMIGDGINDAAALKRADVGVAMGVRGTDAAKQTASIVLGDDRFSTIGVAVEQGRVIYENIRKFVFYLFSCNLAEILVLLVASVAGTSAPLLPLQLLWLNLVTDTFPALALALEPSEPRIMRRPPRAPQEAILSRRFVGALAGHAAVITTVTLASYLWGLGGGADRATTLAFATLGLAQLFHLGNARSHGPVVSKERIFANRWALASVPTVLLLQLAAVQWSPLGAILGTTPLSLAEWGVVIALASVPAVLGQSLEIVQERLRG